tara:strand:- start:2819 stop:3439 length:621 start_codon:yes stop_codon:yes gene_type:complete
MGDIKIYDLKTAIKKCNIEYFVETGTLRGDAVDYMLQFNSLKKLISFEIVEQLAREATDRFKGDERVEIVFGDSSKEIENKLKEIKGNAIFWLDAHFPGADVGINDYTNKMDKDTNLPLEKEIAAISERKLEYNDIIIVDDLWIYDADKEYEWGTFDSHMKRHGHNVTRDQVNTKDSTFIREAFKETHTIKEVSKFQGSLVIIPNL